MTVPLINRLADLLPHGGSPSAAHAIALGFILAYAQPPTGSAVAEIPTDVRLDAIRQVLDALDMSMDPDVTPNAAVRNRANHVAALLETGRPPQGGGL